ncbi:MAG: nucleotidyltransferase domain-containing protein [Bacillota bacterium]
MITFIKSYTEVNEAVLFGSRALGTYKGASDVDIALKGEAVTSGLAAKMKFDIEDFYCDLMSKSRMIKRRPDEMNRSDGVFC